MSSRSSPKSSLSESEDEEEDDTECLPVLQYEQQAPLVTEQSKLTELQQGLPQAPLDSEEDSSSELDEELLESNQSVRKKMF